MRDENVDPDVRTIPEEGSGGADMTAQVAALTAERDRLAAEKAELQDMLLRRQADFENYRKRAERDRSDFLQFAGMEFVRELLPILDDFERALQTKCTSLSYSKGVELIYTRLYEALKKLGLEPMETVGQTFDPNLHQAVEKVETDEAGDQSILGEFQKGYRFKGKLLRPAMVRVAVRPS
ncbi:MAG TPA: nucleotide exchange factor GrpE [Bryobacteraceae bacterium]|nr:nucleotide exchange factor GrpE [Bryobacteraceae bacterium]